MKSLRMKKVAEMVAHTGSPKTFDKMGINPSGWKHKSKQLKRSSEVLWVEICSDHLKLKNAKYGFHTPGQYKVDIMHTYLFLAGLSIENLLKCLVILKNPEYVKNGKLRERIIKSHNLVKLAEHLKLILTDNEKAFCETATECIMSFGRYPIPKDASHMKGMISIRSDINKVYTELFEDLYAKIEQTAKAN